MYIIWDEKVLTFIMQKCFLLNKCTFDLLASFGIGMSKNNLLPSLAYRQRIFLILKKKLYQEKNIKN